MLALPAPPPAIQESRPVNRTPEARRLGLARAAFFRAVLRAPAPRGEGPYPGYVGYASMLMSNHTDVYWPLGRADELVFDCSADRYQTLTLWRRVKGRPRRLFQITYTPGPRAFPYGGTMSRILGRVRAQVSPRDAKPLKALLAARRAYAFAIDSASENTFYGGVIRADGSEWPDPKLGWEAHPSQSDTTIDADGFLVTAEELRLLALPQRRGG